MKAQIFCDPARTYVVCVDSYEDKVLRGRIYNVLHESAVAFTSTVDMLLKLEALLDEAKLLQSYEGKEITLGVRPENIVRGNDVKMTVTNCENLGQTTLIHGNLNGHKITAKFREWSNYKYGEQISVSFNRMHFFDKETTNAIR